MAINRVDLYSYASTDTKPTLNIAAHSLLIERDTGNTFIFDGIAWRQTGIAGVPMTKLNGGTWDYGTFPEKDFRPLNAVSDQVDVLVLTGVEGMHRGQFVISGLTVQTVAVNAYDSTGNLIGAIIVVANTAPGTRVAASALGNDIYNIDPVLAASSLRFAKSAAGTETATIRGMLTGAS